jgi:hypothetical protein
MRVSIGMGHVGMPDIIFCYRGLFVAIETKAPGKRNQTTANQDRVIEAIQKAEGFVWVVDNPDDMKTLFNSIDVYLKMEKSNDQINHPQT